jgi:hypothetical protein
MGSKCLIIPWIFWLLNEWKNKNSIIDPESLFLVIGFFKIQKIFSLVNTRNYVQRLNDASSSKHQ